MGAFRRLAPWAASASAPSTAHGMTVQTSVKTTPTVRAPCVRMGLAAEQWAVPLFSHFNDSFKFCTLRLHTTFGLVGCTRRVSRSLCKLDSMTECTGRQGLVNWHGTLCYALLCACLVMASAFVVIELLHATEPEPYFNPPSRLPTRDPE